MKRQTYMVPNPRPLPSHPITLYSTLHVQTTAQHGTPRTICHLAKNTNFPVLLSWERHQRAYREAAGPATHKSLAGAAFRFLGEGSTSMPRERAHTRDGSGFQLCGRANWGEGRLWGFGESTHVMYVLSCGRGLERLNDEQAKVAAGSEMRRILGLWVVVLGSLWGGQISGFLSSGRLSCVLVFW